MSQFHYYGTTAFDWAVGKSEDEVIKKLARWAGAKTIKLNKSKNGGLFAQVCKVELPQAAHYSINQYLPEFIQKEDGVNELRKGERVPIADLKNIRITTVTGKFIPAQ